MNIKTGEFYNGNGAYINADTFALSVAGDFDYVADFNGTIDFNSLNINVGGNFTNNDANNDFTWGANDSLTVLGSASVTAASFTNSGNINANSFDITATDFTNSGTITANALNLSVAGDFDYVADFNGTITTNALNLNIGGDFSNNDAANDFTWGANDTITVLGSASVVADSFNNSGTIAVSSSSFDITATDFTNAGTISANSFNTTVSSTVSGSFDNTGGVLNADTFALSVAGDFDYVAEYLGNGTITTNALNLNIGGDFSNNDSANDFTWGANDTLTVLGSASVVADSFNNSGTIAVSSSSFDITATDFTNAGTISANSFNTTVSSTVSNSFTNTGGVVNADTFALSVAGDFDYANNGTITTTTAYNLNVGGDFSNNDSANDFTWGDNDSLTVSGNADITAASYTQSGVIDVAGDWSINVNDFTYNLPSDNFTWATNDSLTVLGDANITAAEFDNSGTITANALNLSVAGDFDYSSDFLNAGTIAADNLNFTARNGVFTNNATINLADGNLGITANSFNNTEGVVNADTFNLSVAGNFDYTNRGTIATNALNLNVGGDFSNNDLANDFTWGENDTLTVLGSASVFAASFNNSGIITVTNNGFDITATDFTNSGTISR